MVDPFMGVGSSILAAILHGRKAAGVDHNQSYVRIAAQRLNAAYDGTLRKRPLGATKYQPNGNERVAQRPEGWPDIPESREIVTELHEHQALT